MTPISPKVISFPEGQSVWIPDSEKVWKEGVVIKQEGKNVTVQIEKSTNIVIDCYSCFIKEENNACDDMTKLSYLHEPGVLYNLHSRYQNNLIYTYTGNILIALNPFVRFPNLYDSQMKHLYKAKRIGTLSPHVFAIADNAYRSMIEENKNQSILISGESGAGKTETTKLILEYITSVSGNSKEGEQSIESKVLESNPLLEAFGNAKTVRNNNSSRFGKFIEIQFDKNGSVSGAAIRSYLLERSRVVKIASPERNYHCFYQLCYGADEDEVKRYKLFPEKDRAKKYYYLNQSNCFELQGKESNEDEFCNTKRAMNVLGITEEEKNSIFGIIASILHLGNIEFISYNDGVKINEHSKFHLNAVSELLSCDLIDLEESLIKQTRFVANETIKTPLEKNLALAKRDNLAKTLYSKLFDWIVEKINNAIGQCSDSEFLIGVLDIYGFEQFELNSFEQFCINLANEKLQQHFNQHVLKMEQEEYTKEEINWTYIDFVDNKDILNMIEDDNKGILSLLDSACKLQSTKPEDFCLSLYKEFRNAKRFSFSNMSHIDFTIEHYAGKVKYNASEFLSKNLDAVVIEHQTLLSQSKSKFISYLFPAIPKSNSRGGTKSLSLGKRFKQQLKELIDTLRSTQPHYIRCIKPNAKSTMGQFEHKLVMDQLRSGGVLEAVRMCSAGYPTRKYFEDFIERFSLLFIKDLNKNLNDKEQCDFILKKSNLKDYQLGKSQVFLRAGQMGVLDTLRFEKMVCSARIIQTAFRNFIFKIHRARAALKIQTAWRGYVCRQKLKKMILEKCAKIIQKNYRSYAKRKEYFQLKNVTILIQSFIRMHICKMKYKQTRRRLAATVISKFWKGYILRKRLTILRMYVKGWKARRLLKAMKIEERNRKLMAPPRTKQEAYADAARLIILRRLKERSDGAKRKAENELQGVKEEMEKKNNEIIKLQALLKDARTKASKLSQELIEFKNKNFSPLPKNSIDLKNKNVSLQSEKLIDFKSNSYSGQLDRKVSESLPQLPTKYGYDQFPAQNYKSGQKKATFYRSSSSITVSYSKLDKINQFVHHNKSISNTEKYSGDLISNFNPIEDINENEDENKNENKNENENENENERERERESSNEGEGNYMLSKFLKLEEEYKNLEKMNARVKSFDKKKSVNLSSNSMRERRGVKEGGEREGERGGQGRDEKDELEKLSDNLNREFEEVEKMKKENMSLKSKNEDAENKIKKLMTVLAELQEKSKTFDQKMRIKDEILKDLEASVTHLQGKLLGKDKLENEVKLLTSKIIELTEKKGVKLPLDQQQEILLRETKKNLGFSDNGRPISSCIIFKSLLHWNSFNAEHTNIFDRIIENFQSSARNGGFSGQCYWLSNTLHLYFLIETHFEKVGRRKGRRELSWDEGGKEKEREKERGDGEGKKGSMDLSLVYSFSFSPGLVRKKERSGEEVGKEREESLDVIMFKIQLISGIHRLFITILVSIKTELNNMIDNIFNVSFADNSKTSHPKTSKFFKTQVATFWNGLSNYLNQIWNKFTENHLTPGIKYSLMQQILSFINVKVFNSLMVRSEFCPCNYSNGEIMDDGLSRLDRWLHDVEKFLIQSLSGEWKPLRHELAHIKQAVAFMLCENKPRKSVEDLTRMCPYLNLNQLVHLCIWYEDDKYGTKGINDVVIENLWAMVSEDSPMLLLEPDEVPPKPENVISSMEMYDVNDVEIPMELIGQGNLSFLLANHARMDKTAPPRNLLWGRLWG